MCDVRDLVPAFRYLAGEAGNICRLCFDSVDTGVSLDDSFLVECLYYDNNVTYADMLTDLKAHSELSLPRLLCEYCAELIMRAFIFQKLLMYSSSKWHEAIERLGQALESADTINYSAKSAYFVIQKDSTHVKTGRKAHVEKTKVELTGTILKSIRRRFNYESNSRKKTIICHQCGEKIKSRNLSAHVRRRHNIQEHSCPKCNIVFKKLSSLQDHEERVHAPKTIPCPNCDKKFSTQRMLRCHTTRHHITATCKRCFKQFPSRVALNLHSGTHDTHQCPRCLKKFKCGASLSQHTRRCQNDRDTVICDFCNKSFCNKNSLKGHMATLHGFGGMHTCKWCNKSFDAACKLKVHEVKHTRERSFSCDQCGGLFVTKAALTYHIRIHTGEKPFSCDVCGEKFLSASRRMRHVLWKHRGPELACSLCSSKFRTKSELRRHFVRHMNPQSKLYVSEV